MKGSKVEIVTDFLKGGVLKPKLIVEALSKRGVSTTRSYVTAIKSRLLKNKKIKKNKTKIDLISDLLKEGFDNQYIIKALRRKGLIVKTNYISFVKRNLNTRGLKDSKKKEKRDTIYFREKGLKYWAKELNISYCRAYQLYNKNELGPRIDGTWKTKKSEILFHGKSLKDWSKELGYSIHYIRYLYKTKILESKINNTWKRKENNRSRRMIQGKNLSQWAKLLGFSRERARQLANNGELIKRIKALNKEEIKS